MAADGLLGGIVAGHPANQSETWHEQVASGAYRSNYQAELANAPANLRRDFEELIAAQEELSGLEDMRRPERWAAIVNYFKEIWNGVRKYYEENMALIRNGQWLLATGRLAVDAALFAAEEVVVTGIVTAIIGITAGVAAGMALMLRSAVRAMLSVVRTGTRVVHKIRANYVFRIELRKVEPGVLYSNPIPFNVTVKRKLNYRKTIDVEKDLTPDERHAMGEGAQGSHVEADVDHAEAGTQGASPPDSKVTRLSDREVRTERGQNIKTTTYDPETGRPISETGTIRQDFGSTPRGDNSAAIGRLGETGDQGGHLGGHRFFGDTPDEGIAPQAANLNMGAWRTMENEWADWTKLGYEVR